MLEEQDIKKIGEVVDHGIQASEARLSQIMDHGIQASEARLSQIMDHGIQASEARLSQIMDHGIQASEARLSQIMDHGIQASEARLSQIMDHGIQASEARVIQAVGDMLEQNILPQFDAIRAEMVTKSYLDDKLADLRGDLVVLTRKEDTKLRELVTVLHEKNILTDPDIKRILSMEPFSQLML